MSTIRVVLNALLLSVVLLFSSNSLYAQSCNIQSGTIAFEEGASSLSTSAKEQLNRLAADLRASPNCKVVVQGNGSTNKRSQQLSWEHATNIIEYLTDNGNIVRERFIIMIAGKGDESEAGFRAANDDETGPSTLPPPYPQFRH